MAKTTGMGHNLYFSGIDISNDICVFDEIGGGNEPQNMTGIDKFAYERMGGLRDGRMKGQSYLNTTVLVSAHAALAPQPTTDIQTQYWCGTTQGVPVACMQGKQLGYDGKRGEDGSMKFDFETLGNGWSLEWGDGLTAGKRSDTVATNGTGLDYGAAVGSTLFGAQAYFQCFSFTGTLAAITVQDSTDNVSFAAIPQLAFAAASAPGNSRVQTTSRTEQIDRYVRVITSGTFSQITFAVAFVRNITLMDQ